MGARVYTSFAVLLLWLSSLSYADLSAAEASRCQSANRTLISTPVPNLSATGTRISPPESLPSRPHISVAGKIPGDEDATLRSPAEASSPQKNQRADTVWIAEQSYRNRIEAADAKYSLVRNEHGYVVPFAHGGDGDLYFGFENGQSVAVKVPRTSNGTERFMSEASFAQQAVRDGVKGILPVRYDPDVHVHVMPVVKGGTLHNAIAEYHVVDSNSALKAIDLLDQLSSAVEGMNRNGVVHRDLKPNNVLMDPQGHPQVIDFGLAADQDGFVLGHSEGVVSGTPSHMSTDQLAGKAADRSQDAFALSIVAWEVISGQLVVAPRSESTVEKTLTLGFDKVPRPAKSLAAMQKLAPYLHPLSSLGMFRPASASEMRELLSLARKAVDAQQEVERMQPQGSKLGYAARTIINHMNSKYRRELAEKKAYVREAVEAFYRSEAVLRQVERLRQQYPENIERSPELAARFSTPR